MGRHPRLLHLSERQGRRRRRQDLRPGMRDGLYGRARLRVLRALQERLRRGAGRGPVHDLERLRRRGLRQGAGRQAARRVGRGRPRGRGRRQRLPLPVPVAVRLLDRVVDRRRLHRQAGRRLRQAQGPEDRDPLPRLRLRPRHDRGAGDAFEEIRLRGHRDPGSASRRAAAGAVAADQAGRVPIGCSSAPGA